MNTSRSHAFALAAHAWAMETTSGPEPGWEFAHTPLPRPEQGLPENWRSTKDWGEGLWLPHDLHQIHGILQSEDVGRCCFFSGHTLPFFKCGFFCDNWFELWDIYEYWRSRFSRETAKAFWENGGELTISRSESAKKGWDKISPEDRKARAEKVKQTKAEWTPEQKAEIRRRTSETQAEHWKNKTEEERKAHGEKIREATAKRTPEQEAEIGRKISENLKASWQNKTEEDRKAHGIKTQAARAEWTPEQKAETKRKVSQTWENKTEEEKEAHAEKSREANAKRTPEQKAEISRKVSEKLKASWQRRREQARLRAMSQNDPLIPNFND